MRTSIPLLLLFAKAALSAAIGRRDGAEEHSSLAKRQTLAQSKTFQASKAAGGRYADRQTVWDMFAYGKVPDPPGAAPRRVNLPTESKIPGAKRVKVRSGPYIVPNMGKKIFGHNGMLYNHPDFVVERPCEGECTLLWQQAGLEYPNGTNGMLLPPLVLCGRKSNQNGCVNSKHRYKHVVSLESSHIESWSV